MLNNQTKLTHKYDVPGPRYTSYPTVPFWDEFTFSVRNWEHELSIVDGDEGISLYLHLPFCESLCTYCGCTTRITKNHNVELPYMDSLLQEWEMYCTAMGFAPEIKEIHLGGGTPTFFSAGNLKGLLEKLLKYNQNQPEISVEGHPNSTTREHLLALYGLGARRLSLGIQDFDGKVQQQINRIQSYQQVKSVCDQAREIGFKSINFDLIYGLPHQDTGTIARTIDQTISLQPDRIAFYSYAHVPWLKKAQKSYEQYLPSGSQKRSLYELGKEMLQDHGYQEIGMDHFSLASDELYKAFRDGSLHRNFMGYTTQATRYVIGLGVSAISDIWTGFSQNIKNVEVYQEMVGKGELPVLKGHILNDEDLQIRRHILNIMCQFETDFSDQIELGNSIKVRLSEMEKDGLLTWEGNRVLVLEKGKPFVRNICMSLDLRMLRKKPESQLFSQTV